MDLAEKPFAPSSIFLAHTSTAAMDQELLIVEPGIMRIEKPFALMTEIQLKTIVGRLGKVDANQKTDRGEMMTVDGQTFSKYNYRAIKLGADVCSNAGTPSIKFSRPTPAPTRFSRIKTARLKS